MYKVVERFISINGEGTKAGELAVFIRFLGCNLDCSYCDTKWANQKDAYYEEMSKEDIKNYIEETGVENVTLTGGEPLLQKNFIQLLETLQGIEDISIEIETNGSLPILALTQLGENIKITMDYKLSGSHMEEKMYLKNLGHLRKIDTIKFVVSHKRDLECAYKIIQKYNLVDQTHVYLSPVFGKIEPYEMVEFMKEHIMNGTKLQIQMHKIIWDPQKKGV